MLLDRMSIARHRNSGGVRMPEVFAMGSFTRPRSVPLSALSGHKRQLYTPARALVVGDASAHEITATINTADTDRFGTVVEPGGMRPINGAPVAMLYGHDASEYPVGVWSSIDQEAASIVATGQVSDEEVWALVVSGAIAGVSIGFIAHATEYPDDGPPRITDWELVEISLTPVPANPSAIITEARSMPPTITSTATEVVPFTPKLVREIAGSAPAILRGRTPAFSLSTVITAAVKGEPLRGFEREICDELARRSDVETRGIRVPARMFQAPQRRVLESSPPISPDQFMQELLDDMAAARRWGTLSRRLGYTIVSSARETVHIPRRTQVLQAGWGAKDHVAAESDTDFARDTLTPRYASATTTIQRSALRYGDPAMDALLTQDLGNALDDTIDTGLLFGAGGATNQPAGLLTTIPAGLIIDKNNAAITADDLVRLKSLMASTWRLDDTLSGLRWCTNPAIVDRLRQTSKKEGAATPLDEWQQSVYPYDVAPGQLLDIMLVQSGRIMPEGVGAPGNTQYRMYLVYGAMAVIVYFGGASVDLLVDPYTLSTSGAVRITGFVDVNCTTRDPNTVAAIIRAQSTRPPAPPP
jgi:HK97 family phage major capsid protein/HK97 family phage prohead protease